MKKVNKNKAFQVGRACEKIDTVFNLEKVGFKRYSHDLYKHRAVYSKK